MRLGKGYLKLTIFWIACALATSACGFKTSRTKTPTQSQQQGVSPKTFQCQSESVWGPPQPFRGPIADTGTRANSIYASPSDELYVSAVSLHDTTSVDLFVRRSLDRGKTWENFLVETGVGPLSGSGSIAEFGSALYLTAAVDVAGSRFWRVYRSQNKGATWAVVDDYQEPTGQGVKQASPAGLGRDALGNIYVVGQATVNGVPNWIVRRSATGNAGSWTVVDRFLDAGFTSAQAVHMLTATDNTLWIAGAETDAAGLETAILRRSTDNGTTWTTNQAYRLIQTKGTRGRAIFQTGGALFHTAAATDAADVTHWIIRRSFDNGVNWAVVDDYIAPNSGIPTGAALPRSFAADAATNLSVGGIASNGPNAYAVVRRSSNVGRTWTTTLLGAGGNINSMAADSQGNLYYAGSDSTGTAAVGKFTVGYPKSFSETCLARSANQTIENGKIYDIAPKYVLWTDSAVKKRWLYLPAGAKVNTANMSAWIFPKGTQLWKEFARGGVKVETRHMIKIGDGKGPDNWQYVTYKWRPDQTDADLFWVGEKNALGTQHDIPAVNRCMNCHLGASDVPLGLDALQMSQPGAPAERLTLAKMSAQGLVTQAANQDYEIQGSALAKQALGYAHANCGHCHNPDGAANFFPHNFRHNLDAISLQTENFYVTTVGKMNSAGTFTLIAPHNKQASLVRNRMAVRTPTGPILVPDSNPPMTVNQMPPLGTDEVDPEGLAAMEAWIDELP